MSTEHVKHLKVVSVDPSEMPESMEPVALFGSDGSQLRLSKSPEFMLADALGGRGQVGADWVMDETSGGYIRSFTKNSKPNQADWLSEDGTHFELPAGIYVTEILAYFGNPYPDPDPGLNPFMWNGYGNPQFIQKPQAAWATGPLLSVPDTDAETDQFYVTFNTDPSADLNFIKVFIAKVA